jgi:hypothetical protein
MHDSPGFALPSTTLLVEVDVAPKLAEIHNEFAPLLRLSGVCAATNVTSAAVSSGISASNFSGSDDEESRGGRSPAMSPVRAAESRLAELTAPVTVTLPPPMSEEDSAFIAHYVHSFRVHEEAEKAYIAFIFQEYKKRKGIEQKRLKELGGLRQELEALRERELPPEVRAAVEKLVKSEETGREAVWTAYGKFLEWIACTIPQWIEAAQRQEQMRLADEKAKKAAMEAAREALAHELAMGKQLGGLSGGGGGGRVRTTASSCASPSSPNTASAVDEDGTLSYEPAVSVDQQVEASQDPTASLCASELRRKAIRMLEAEEEEMKRRRDEQLRRLRVQEEQLRAEIALKRQHEAEQATRKEREAAQEHEGALAQRYNALLEQEFMLQSRLREREEAKAKKEAERQMLMEHIAAEELLLRQRIQEKEDRRKASEEEAARIAREKKMREIQEQEEALRRRIAEREAAAAAERKVRNDAARREAEAAAVYAEQEAVLQRAKDEQARAEKARQLAYLRDQEEAYKRHIRERELAEIEEKRRAAEAHWTHPTLPTSHMSSHSISPSSPMPTTSMAMPGPTQVSYYTAQQAGVPPAASYAPTAAPMMPAAFYDPYAAPGAVVVVPPPQPQQQLHTAFPSPYAAYPGIPAPPPTQMPMTQGYSSNPMGYYPRAAPPGMATLRTSPYAPAAMYQQ